MFKINKDCYVDINKVLAIEFMYNCLQKNEYCRVAITIPRNRKLTDEDKDRGLSGDYVFIEKIFCIISSEDELGDLRKRIETLK